MGHVDTDVVIYTVIFVPFHLGFAFTGATLTLSTPGPLPAACQKQPVGCSHSQFAQLFGSRLRSHSCSYLCSHSAPSMQAMQPATPAEVAYLNGCDAPPTPTEPVSLKVIDYVIDLFFVSDILLNLRTTYLRPDGKYETSIRAIGTTSRTYYCMFRKSHFEQFMLLRPRECTAYHVWRYPLVMNQLAFGLKLA